MAINEDSVRISVKDGGDGDALQTTIGTSSVTSSQASQALHSQLSALSTRSVTLFKKQVTYRELIFIGCTAALFFAALGLMVTVIMDDQTLAYEKKMVTCVDYDCYKSASSMQRKLNTSFGACDNFYKYACGRWTESQQFQGTEIERTVVSELEVENLKRLNDVIMGEIDPLRKTDWAYEGKVQKVYKACLDQYQTTNYYDYNNPLVDKITAMGGWYVFNNLKNFNWVSAHRDVLGKDNMVDVFFYWDVEPWDQQHSTYIITIREDWLIPLPYPKWFVPGYDFVTPYKTLLTNVAKMMSEDYGVNDPKLDQRITDFVNDVITVEKGLAQAQKDNEAEILSNRPTFYTLGMLAPLAPGFDWVSYFNKTLFESKRPVTYSTPVVVRTPRTLSAVTRFMFGLRPQQFNNYLVWRLIYSYLDDMSFEYNHQKMAWQSTLKGSAIEYKPNWVYCMETMRGYMDEALDGLFVRRHFTNIDKAEINFISETLRNSVASEVNGLDWMDDATRAIASEKVSKTIEKLGYPDWLDTDVSAQNMLDFTYMYVNATEKDHFQNVQQLRQHRRRSFATIYEVGRDPIADWRETPLYSVRSTYFYPWNEMVVPAGLLQFPMFSGYDPAMYRMQTYGSAGFRLARGYLYGIAENGQYFDKYGNQLSQSWFSADSAKTYSDRKQCFTDWYGKVKTEPLVHNGQKVQKQLVNPQVYAAQAMIDIGSLRNAYTAYVGSDVQSQDKTASERFLPGVPAQSKNEYFFLSFAQSHCAVRTDEATYERMTEASIWLPEELMVNNLLMHIPQFASTFSCPSGSAMNPGNTCPAVF